MVLSGAGLLVMAAVRLHGDVAPTTLPATLPMKRVTTAPAAFDVDALIKQLGSDDAGERDSAQKQLVAMGQSVVPALKKAADSSDDPEIQSRAAAALAQMKDADSNGVSFITLHLKDAAPADALSVVAAQAHTHFGGPGTGAPAFAQGQTVTVDADHKPFWDVLADICTQTGRCPMMGMNGRDEMMLMPSPRNWLVQSPHQVVGPFWVGVAGLYHTRNIDLMTTAQTDDQFQVRLLVMPEPKLSVTQMSEFVVKEATDDAGNSLLPRTQVAAITRMFRNARMMNNTVSSSLSYPAQPGKKIKVLRGEVKMMIAEDVQQFEIDNVLGTPKVTKPLPNRKIQATVTRASNDVYRGTIQCTRDGLDEDQWQAMISHAGEITLEDADGHAYMTNQTNIAMATGSTDTLTINAVFFRNAFAAVGMNGIPAAGAVAINKVGDPRRLVWNVATTVKPVVVPVSFKDLPMP
jgi:hypothetical protein